MNYAYETFTNLINDTRIIDSLYAHICKNTRELIDVSDLLRWQWIQCVSAFDKLIHDLVRIGMIEIFNGAREKTPKYSSFNIDITAYKSMSESRNDAPFILEKIILQKNGYRSFQDPDAVADALSYIWNNKRKWAKLASQIKLPEDTCKITLKNIIMRRNQIVHEGDCIDRVLTKQIILHDDVEDVRNFILDLGKAIYLCVKDA